MIPGISGLHLEKNSPCSNVYSNTNYLKQVEFKIMWMIVLQLIKKHTHFLKIFIRPWRL